MNIPVTKLKNIGLTTGHWLNHVGIFTREDLEEIGVVEAYKALKAHVPTASLNVLWAMDGALTNKHWTKISNKRKTELLSSVSDCI